MDWEDRSQEDDGRGKEEDGGGRRTETNGVAPPVINLKNGTPWESIYYVQNEDDLLRLRMRV